MSTYVEEIEAEIQKTAQAQAETFRRATKEFTDHPLLYVALAMSAMLSMFAGIAIGLGVRVEDGIVIAKTDLPNIFAALLYGVSFPVFFEYALANWLKKFLMREPENKIQMWVSAAMIILTFLGTCVTAYSASDVIATAFGFFASFQDIPAGIQKWIVYALPTMFMLNVAAGEAYRQFSQEAVLLRGATMKLRKAQVSADMEVSLAQMDAKKNIALHAAKTYSDNAQREAEGIGSRRGAEKWKKDKGDFDLPTTKPTQPTPANAPQTVAYAAGVTNYLEGLEPTNPTNGQE